MLIPAGKNMVWSELMVAGRLLIHMRKRRGTNIEP
jgi:hypothetical protein